MKKPKSNLLPEIKLLPSLPSFHKESMKDKEFKKLWEKEKKARKNKESQSQQAAGYSLSLKLGNNCRSKLRGITTPSLSNKRCAYCNAEFTKKTS